jgi:NAD(P)-dependent dehydrogenase (short-subunit alcohol dehydrogenase family)
MESSESSESGEGDGSEGDDSEGDDSEGDDSEGGEGGSSIQHATSAAAASAAASAAAALAAADAADAAADVADAAAAVATAAADIRRRTRVEAQAEATMRHCSPWHTSPALAGGYLAPPTPSISVDGNRMPLIHAHLFANPELWQRMLDFNVRTVVSVTSSAVYSVADHPAYVAHVDRAVDFLTEHLYGDRSQIEKHMHPATLLWTLQGSTPSAPPNAISTRARAKQPRATATTVTTILAAAAIEFVPTACGRTVLHLRLIATHPSWRRCHIAHNLTVHALHPLLPRLGGAWLYAQTTRNRFWETSPLKNTLDADALLLEFRDKHGVPPEDGCQPRTLYIQAHEAHEAHARHAPDSPTQTEPDPELIDDPELIEIAKRADAQLQLQQLKDALEQT